MIEKVFKNKTILVTGHTGFKGSWLVMWLLKLNAKVVGVSIDIPTSPSLFKLSNLKDKIDHYFLDITNIEELNKVVKKYNPDFIFHFAAQAIVSKSYKDPLNTFKTNVIGTVNLLEVLRTYKRKSVAIFITSDKCYENVESVWGYKENDSMGGKDVYSGSKGAAELAIKSYFNSFFKDKDHPVRIGVGRAGNVIGGGDWAEDRIVVDSMKSWIKNKPVMIRNPNATRPWQHVLEPLSGYLTLAKSLYERVDLNGEPFNFGPHSNQNFTVHKLLKDLSKKWGWDDHKKSIVVNQTDSFKEAGLLKLNIDKAQFYLRWEPNLSYEETIDFISEWYKNYTSNKVNNFEFTMSQIEKYQQLSIERKRIWMYD